MDLDKLLASCREAVTVAARRTCNCVPVSEGSKGLAMDLMPQTLGRDVDSLHRYQPAPSQLELL